MMQSMLRLCSMIPIVLGVLGMTPMRLAVAQSAVDSAPTTVPIAILGVQEKGENVATLGTKISSLIYAELSTYPEIVLVEREELEELLRELRLNLSGIVDPSTANRVGMITGARILVSLSVLEVDQNNYLVAKIIGTETSRVIGASSKATKEEGLETLVKRLAESIHNILLMRSAELLPKPVAIKDRLAKIAKSIGDGPRPTVAVNIPESHVGKQVADPAAQTELLMILKELGFTVYDNRSNEAKNADIQLTGTGLTEFAAERSGLVSVRARLELTAEHTKSKTTLAANRQSTIVVELSEQLASKSALQQAAASSAERLIVKMMAEYKKVK